MNERKHLLLKSVGLALAFLLLPACTGSKNKKEDAAETTESRNLTVPVGDSYYLQAYVAPFCYSVTAEIDGKDYLIGYNNKIHAVDFINLTDRVPGHRVQLQKDGPDAVLGVHGLEYYKGDLFLATGAGYLLADSAGHVKRKIPRTLIMESFPEYRMGKGGVVWMMYKFVSFDRENGTFAVPLYPAGLNENVPDKPLSILRLSIADEKIIDRIEVPYPDELKKEPNWGALNDLNLCVHGDEILFNYAASSDVYRYEIPTGTITRVEIPSQYTDNLFTLSKDELSYADRASVNAGYYFPLQYDPYRKVYWRFHIGHTVEQAAYLDRPYIVTEISPDLKKVKEIEIPAKGLDLYTNLLVTRGGLFLPYYDGLDEEHLTLFRISEK